MAQIHRHIQALLSLLLESPAASLAVGAIARIQSDDDPDLGFDTSRVDRDESPRGRAFRQLELADQAIVWALKRELDLTARLGEIADEFGVDEVNVSPVLVEGRQFVERPDRLISEERRKAIVNFLDVWRSAADDVARALGADFEE